MWAFCRSYSKSWPGILVLGLLIGLLVGYLFWGSGSGTDGSREENHVSRSGDESLLEVGSEGSDSVGRGERLTALGTRYSGQIAEFRDVLTGRRSSTAAKARYYELLMNLTPETAPELRELFSDLVKTTDRNLIREHREFWQRWAEIDGEGACAAIFETNRDLGKDEIRKHRSSKHLAEDTMQAWATKAPAAARDWLLAQGDVPFRDVLIEGFFDGVGRHHPEEAQRFLEEQELSDEVKSHGYLRIAWGHLDKGGVDQVDQWFRSIDEDDPRKKSIGETTAGLITDGDIGEALSWASRLDDIELAEYSNRQLVEERPEELLSYLAKVDDLSAIPDVPGLVSKATHKWLSNYDGDRVKIWLGKQEDNPNYDLLAEPFVRNLVSLSPISAGNWVETIQDPGLRAEIEADLEKSLAR